MLAIAAALLFQLTPSLEPISIADVTPVMHYTAAASSKEASSTTPDGTDKANAAAAQPIEAQPDSTVSPATAANRLSDSQQVKAVEVSLNYSLFSTIRISEPSLSKPNVVGVETLPSRRKWMLLAAMQHSAAGFDAYTTRLAISNGAVERDPILRPFAGSPGIYAAIQAIPVALDYTARKMQRNGNPYVRKMWWVPQSVSTVGFLYSGAHNLRVAGQQ